jgi:hypothetical protein
MVEYSVLIKMIKKVNIKYIHFMDANLQKVHFIFLEEMLPNTANKQI